MSKILLATAILGLGLAGALFAVQQIGLPSNPPVAAQSDNSNISAKPFVEKISDNKLPGIDAKENLTDAFNQVLAQKIAENNPSGPENISGKKSVSVPDPESIAQDLIVEAAKKFDPSKLSPVIKDYDLKISNDDSKSAVITYINSFHKIVQAAADKIPNNIVNNEPDLEQAALLSNIYKEAADEFYSLNVPRVALSIHKRQIVLLIKESYVFSAIANYKNDPLNTILVSQELENINKEFENLSSDFTQFIKKYTA